MAGEDKPKPVNHWEPVIFIIGAFILGAAFIWQRGGFTSLKESGGLLVMPPQGLGTIPPPNSQPTQ